MTPNENELFAVLTIRVSVKGGYSPSMNDEDAITEAFCKAEAAVATALGVFGDLKRPRS